MISIVSHDIFIIISEGITEVVDPVSQIRMKGLDLQEDNKRDVNHVILNQRILITWDEILQIKHVNGSVMRDSISDGDSVY